MRTLINRGSFAVFVTLVFSLMFSSAALGQASLNKALDQDGDNKADFLIFRPSDSVWYANRSNGTQTYTTFGIPTTDIPCPGDYDGDGKGDICIWRDSTGVFWYLESSTNTAKAFQFGLPGDEPVARRWDADNRTDFAVVRRNAAANTMTWYIWYATTNTFAAVPFGLATDYITPGDYDGDGRFDFAVQRNSNGNGVFYIQQSTAGFKVDFWGFASDFVVPGDYDNDGRTDVAVVRDSNGAFVWYIKRSSDNQLEAYQWGTSTSDFAVQGDYDGDGKTDIGVWRDTDGIFYIRSSSNGSLIYRQWGTAGDFPIASYDTH